MHIPRDLKDLAIRGFFSAFFSAVFCVFLYSFFVFFESHFSRVHQGSASWLGGGWGPAKEIPRSKEMTGDQKKSPMDVRVGVGSVGRTG